MAGPITWQNVAAPDFRGVSQIMGQAQDGFNTAFDGLGNSLKKREATDAANWEQQKTNNTNEYMNALGEAKTPEEFQAKQAFLAQMRQGYGAQVNQEAVRAAEESRLEVLQNRVKTGIEYDNILADSKDAPVLDQIAALNAQGKSTEARVLASSLLRSQGKAQKLISDTERSDTLFAQGNIEFGNRVAREPLELDKLRSALETDKAQRASLYAAARKSDAEARGVGPEAFNKVNAEQLKLLNETNMFGTKHGGASDSAVMAGNNSKAIHDTLGKDNVDAAVKLSKLFSSETGGMRTITKPGGESVTMPVVPAIIQRAMAMSDPGGKDTLWGDTKKYGDKYIAEVQANVDKLMATPEVINAYGTYQQLTANSIQGRLPTRNATGLPAPTQTAPASTPQPAPTAGLDKAAATVQPQTPVVRPTQSSVDRRAFMQGVGGIVDAVTFPGRALTDMVGAGLNVGSRVVNAVAGSEIAPKYESVLGRYGAMPLYDQASTSGQASAPLTNPAKQPAFVTQSVIPKAQGTRAKVKVTDGDTISFESLDPNNPVPNAVGNIGRLNYIDANETAKPEFGKEGQRYAEEAKTYLRDKVDGKEVTLRVTGQDSRKDSGKKRNLLDIEIDGVPLDVDMVRNGYVRVFKGIDKSSPHGKQLLAAEEYAQSRRLGVWSKAMRGEAPPDDHRSAESR